MFLSEIDDDSLRCWTEDKDFFFFHVSLPPLIEIQRNREFYKNADVRPPFTYASLIRQVKLFNFSNTIWLTHVCKTESTEIFLMNEIR